MTLSGVGIGLRRSFAAELLQSRRHVDWLEVIPENYLTQEGIGFATLLKCRDRWPMALHGVSLSICGGVGLDPYLESLGRLCERLQPALVSDHLCIAEIEGEPVFDLIPPPFSEAFVDYSAARLRYAQSVLGRTLCLENITRYVTMPNSSMNEGTFVRRVLDSADARLLLDVNNLYINAVNHNMDPLSVLAALPLHRVQQIHLGGHMRDGTRLLDTHSRAIVAPVWNLFRATLQHTGRVPVLIEWDQDIPSLDAVLDEADRAREILNEQTTWGMAAHG